MPATKKRKVKPTAKAKANMIFRNCGICRKNCKIASICCDNCDTWYHLRCEELELADYEMFLTEKNLNYSCKGCFSHDQSDEYTYTSALLRLTERQSCLGHATSTGTVASTLTNDFFSHLQCFLDDIPGAQFSGKSLVFDSDEEKALTKAIQKCFPDSQQILCTRHIEENFKRHLREVIGEKDPKLQHCAQRCFGVDGLLSSPDDVEFDLKVMELEAKYEYSVPAVQRYFSSSTSSLKNYVWEPAQKDIAPINWKNNSCESMNNILKLSTNWKAVKLPDLIGKLHKIVQLQYRDIRRALHGQGNYALAPWARKLQVTEVVWSSKCAKEKDAIFRKLMNLSKPRDNFVESSDGKLKIP
ncbi:Hypothetical predicted protein [Mytilus galloprovincialis]|uniref:Zinc finger PHD-type domain-containing protein n=1 Tax=Mytilus galloprovincialis TaxID=29158 RepID=A0A8B6GSX2_MYTGA|nr:Hypothetical predicted protein [Mytilus galloprovincialis]